MVDNSGFVGGGGLEQTVSLEAGENMSIGDNWFLGADGKAYKYRNYLKSLNFASLYPTEAAGNYSLFRLHLNSASNKMVAIVRDNDTNDIYAGIILVNATSGALTIGALTDLNINLTGAAYRYTQVGSNKVLVTNAASGTMSSFVLDFSGTTPVVGAVNTVSPTSFNSAITAFEYDSVNDKVIMIYKENTGNYRIFCVVGTISGNTITWGSTETLFSDQSWTSSLTAYTLFDPVEAKIIFVFRNFWNSSNHVQISAFSIDISGVSVSTGSKTDLISNGSSQNDFFDSSNSFAKLGNGNYLAVGYFDYPQAKAYVGVLKIATGGTAITATQAELRDSGSNRNFQDACQILSVGTSGKFLVGVTDSNVYPTTDFLYLLNYDGTTLSSPEQIYSADVNTFNPNIANTTGEVVLHNIERTVDSTQFNTIQVFDFSVSNNVLGYYDFGNTITMPYMDGNSQANKISDVIQVVNGVSFYLPYSVGVPCLTLDSGKIILINPLGAVSQAITSGQTYKFIVKAAKQGNKPINFTGANLKPPSSYYMNGDSLNWYASNNNDESFDSEYLGYCLTDDVLIINSSSSKET